MVIRIRFPRCRFRLATVALLLVSAACASTPKPSRLAGRPHPEERPDKALVWIIAGIAPGGARHWIFDSRSPLGALTKDSYLFAYLDPGLHLLWTRMGGGSPANGRGVYMVEAARTYYLGMTPIGGSPEMPAFALVPLTQKEFDSACQRADFYPQTEAILEKGRKMVDQYAGEVLPIALLPETSFAPPDVGGRIRLPAGTPIALELEENATSLHVEAGQKLRFKVAEDLKVGGETVVPAGLPVEGFIRRAAHPTIGGVGGFMEVEITYLRLPDDSAIPVVDLISTSGWIDPGGMLSSSIFSSGISNASSLTPYAGPWNYVGLGVALFALPGALRKGADPWLLAGMRTTMLVRSDTSAPPASTTAEVAETTPAREGRVVSVQSSQPILVTQKGRLADDWIVRLDLDAPPKEVSVVAVSDTALPVRAAATKIRQQKEGCELTFTAWSVVRWARLMTSKGTIPVLLRGTSADGTPFFATAQLVVQEEKKTPGAP
jgi:hypothetical protein